MLQEGAALQLDDRGATPPDNHRRGAEREVLFSPKRIDWYRKGSSLLLETLDQIDKSTLQKLCDDGCPESQTLDFKRDLPGRSGNPDKEKHELLKDVCAFANTDGGDLVYGVAERDGAAEVPVPITGELADAAKRRISQILDAGVEPRIHGVRLHHIDVDDGYVLVIRVPASFDGPHCVRTNSNRRFVMRNGTTTTDMSFDQLRVSFGRTASLADQARRFIEARIELIIRRKTCAPLVAGPGLILHLVPVSGVAGRQTVDLRTLHSKSFTDFIGDDWGSGARTFNFDGLLVNPSGQQTEGFEAYNHIFRTGAIEGGRSGGVMRPMPGGGEKAIVWSSTMSKFFRDWVSKFVASVSKWGFLGPAVLGVAVLDVKGYELAIGDTFNPFRRAAVDRSHLVLPNVWIDDVNAVNVDAVVGPQMDILWQAFGAARCIDFDEQSGVYRPSQS